MSTEPKTNIVKSILLGRSLRYWREKAGLGPIKVACKALGVSHATLGMYERSEASPDVEFLAVFANRTGADFNELLRFRLAAGKTKEARSLAEQLQPVRPIKTEQALNQVLDAIKEDIDSLFELSEVDGDESGLTIYPKDKDVSVFINKIKMLLISGVDGALAQNIPQGQQSEVEPKLMAEIVVSLEKAYINSELFVISMRKFIDNNRDQINLMMRAIKSQTEQSIDEKNHLMNELAQSWLKYASIEAGIAAYIYNKVSSIHDEQKRSTAIKSETNSFLELRLINASIKVD